LQFINKNPLLALAGVIFETPLTGAMRYKIRTHKTFLTQTGQLYDAYNFLAPPAKRDMKFGFVLEGWRDLTNIG